MLFKTFKVPGVSARVLYVLASDEMGSPGGGAREEGGMNSGQTVCVGEIGCSATGCRSLMMGGGREFCSLWRSDLQSSAPSCRESPEGDVWNQ